jgi:hypothetical protein
MKSKQSNRSSLTIDAVAQAAAQGAATALLPGRKLTAVAALAGFVLRLFRRNERTTDGVRTECGARAEPERSGSDAGAKRAPSGGRRNRLAAVKPARIGGRRHG